MYIGVLCVPQVLFNMVPRNTCTANCCTHVQVEIDIPAEEVPRATPAREATLSFTVCAQTTAPWD